MRPFDSYIDLVTALPEWFFLPLQPFVWHPERIAIVSALFVFAFLRIRRFVPAARRWPLLLPAIAWAAFVPWEWYARRAEANIRIDLLFIFPHLLAVTFAGILFTFLPSGKTSSPGSTV